ncbi:hypothetical protein Vadar_004469 [Vaccinium darrowii]|uniref:Uncharacterized protein n=1 Tax=Vaccinium darrowii TaxID=229202 RepID=A0ACB7X7B2_9ERIC|nr:hypothetical protein Vadar_004469 [Vaccinium darrowii]
MALQNLLSQLRHKGLRSSSAIRSANICGVGTALSKSTLLLPWSPSTQHFQTLPHFASLTRSLHSGNSRRNLYYDEGNSPSRGRYRDRIPIFHLQQPVNAPKCHKVLYGEAGDRLWMHRAIVGVTQSVVCLSLLKEGEASMVFSGTVVRSDGIVATSAACLKPLKGTEYKIGVKILDLPDTYFKGVLVHTDFLSKIAFVKILCRRQLRVPKWGELGSMSAGHDVVAAGSERVYGSWKDTESRYSLGVFSSIADDKEKTESHNARASGQLIKASCDIEKPGIGGPLAKLTGEVIGVIHKTRGCQIEATPIEDVLKYLEYFEKHGEHAKDKEGL